MIRYGIIGEEVTEKVNTISTCAHITKSILRKCGSSIARRTRKISDLIPVIYVWIISEKVDVATTVISKSKVTYSIERET